MNILVDENVPFGREAFSTLGAVRTAPGRVIDNAMLADVDALVVRSVTQVNAELLSGTPVRFAGTCTIGEDHIDKAWLAEQGIAFSSAPGCNANSVGQYIVSALVTLAEKHGFTLEGRKLGIVGVGNVGSRVLEKAAALGMQCVLNDPPLAEKTGDDQYRPIDEIFDCDIVTLHVPLEHDGPHPTWHLADAAFIARMRDGAILLNSSRGPVADNAAMEAALASGKLAGAVLDVWEGEPEIGLDLLRQADIGTPHIAGYSFDGKVNGTRQVYEALCAALGKPPAWDPTPLLPAPEVPELTFDAPSNSIIPRAVKAVYDIMRDDDGLRALFAAAPGERVALFDRLRKNYPRRREFFNTRVRLGFSDPDLAARLAGIGFNVE